MAVQTPAHVSLLSKILHWAEIAAMAGTEIPVPQVQAIAAIIEASIGELQTLTGGTPVFKEPGQVTLPPAAAPAVVQPPHRNTIELTDAEVEQLKKTGLLDISGPVGS